MTAHEPLSVQASASAAPPISESKAGSMPGGASADRVDWPKREDSLWERFLNHLRLALAAPHT